MAGLEATRLGEEIARGAQAGEETFSIFEGLPRRKKRSAVRLSELAEELEQQAIEREALKNQDLALSQPLRSLTRELETARTQDELSQLPTASRLRSLTTDLGIGKTEREIGLLPKSTQVAEGAQDVALAQQRFLMDALQSGEAQEITDDQGKVIAYSVVDSSGRKKIIRNGTTASTEDKFQIVTGADGRPHRINVTRGTMEPIAVPKGFQGKTAGAGKGSKLSEDERKGLISAASQASTLPEILKSYDDLHKKNKAGVLAGKVQRGMQALGVGDAEFSEANARIMGNLFGLARALQGGGVLTETDIKRMEALVQPLSVGRGQFEGSLKGIARLMADKVKGFKKVRSAALDDETRQAIDQFEAELEAFAGGSATPSAPSGDASVSVVEFETEEDASAAGLPAGTEVIIGGRRAIIEED